MAPALPTQGMNLPTNPWHVAQPQRNLLVLTRMAALSLNAGLLFPAQLLKTLPTPVTALGPDMLRRLTSGWPWPTGEICFPITSLG